MKSIFSIDVEDWFHIPSLSNTPDVHKWGALPSRVEKNFIQLLDVLSKKNVRVTCFFLGWVAQQFPYLVQEAKARGHEIASHGYAHQLAYDMGEKAFLQDIKKAKDIIETISGEKVYGYRAPGFSITKDTPWFFDKLVEAGYTYDSSIFPAPRGFGGLKTNKYAPHVICCEKGRIAEFPITAIDVCGKPCCFFGGGYLRLSPSFFIRKMGLRVLAQDRPIIFYIHPREIDVDQPRLAMPLERRFNSYVNLKTTRNKVMKILDQFEVTTFSEFMKEHVIKEG